MLDNIARCIFWGSLTLALFAILIVILLDGPPDE